MKTVKRLSKRRKQWRNEKKKNENWRKSGEGEQKISHIGANGIGVSIMVASIMAKKAAKMLAWRRNENRGEEMA